MTSQEHRVKHGRPTQRAWTYWTRKARELAQQHRLDANGVLDEFDALADLYEWGGDERAAAEQRAWADTVELLTRAA